MDQKSYRGPYDAAQFFVDNSRLTGPEPEDTYKLMVKCLWSSQASEFCSHPR